MGVSEYIKIEKKIKNGCYNNIMSSNDILEELIIYGNKNIHKAGVSNKHYCVIFQERKKCSKILCYGMNHIRNGKTIHAEVDAINNLPPSSKRNRLMKVSLMVIRINKHNKICNSRCCVKCCESIYSIPSYRGYVIDQIYYSNEEGEIEYSHPISLLLNVNVHKSSYFKKKNYKPRLPDKIKSSPTLSERYYVERLNSI